jgi:hypothetical protein
LAKTAVLSSAKQPAVKKPVDKTPAIVKKLEQVGHCFQSLI